MYINFCLFLILGTEYFFKCAFFYKFYRNDLYLTLERGEFERGGKSTGKNIEVSILVLDSAGAILEVIYLIIFFHLVIYISCS